MRHKVLKRTSQITPLILETPKNWGNSVIYPWTIKVAVMKTLFIHIDQLDMGDDVVDLIFKNESVHLQRYICQTSLFAVANTGSMGYLKIRFSPEKTVNSSNTGMKIWVFQRYLAMQLLNSTKCINTTTAEPEATTPLATTFSSKFFYH